MVTPKSIGNAGIAATDGGERRRNGGLEKIQYVQPQGPPDGVFHKNPRYAEDTEFSKIRRKELVRWNHDYHYKVWRWVSEMLSEKIFMELGSLGAMGMIGS